MHPLDKKRTVVSLKARKKKGEKLSALTAYDFPTAKVASEAGVDLILVGDSLGMVLQGHPNTLKVSLDEILYHTRMVSHAAPLSLVVADMPFGSFQNTAQEAVANAIRLVKEGGAEAIKLEGGRKRFKVIEAILNAEIPVLAHLGLTPQSIHRLGGFKTQGKLKRKADEMLEDAIALQELGVFGIVLESMPQEVAQKISESISIPTIGIGAGKYCDGQILVFHDLLGVTNLYLPKFVRQYADIYTVMREGIQNYIGDIHSGEFPGPKETTCLKEEKT